MSEEQVNSPAHYTEHPSGIECIQVTEHFNFCLGNVIKYIWRAPLKGATLQDLEKARWYLDREIASRKALETQNLWHKWNTKAKRIFTDASL